MLKFLKRFGCNHAFKHTGTYLVSKKSGVYETRHRWTCSRCGKEQKWRLL